MKALLINGSPHEKGCTYTALEELAKTLEAEGIETEIVQAGHTAHSCNACASCKKTFRCVYDDLVNETAPKLAEADALVIGAPVYFASPAGGAISFMDRLFYSTPHINKTMKVGAAVVSCRRQHCLLRRAEQVLHHHRNAHRQQPVLEHGVRQHPGGGAQGRRGAANHADARPQHGLSDEEHSAGPGAVWHSGEGAYHRHQFSS